MQRPWDRNEHDVHSPKKAAVAGPVGRSMMQEDEEARRLSVSLMILNILMENRKPLKCLIRFLF